MKKLICLSLLLLSWIGSRAQNNTIVVMKTRTDYYDQSWFCKGELQTEKIDAHLADGRFVTAASYNAYGWFVSTSCFDDYSEQAYCLSESWPAGWIDGKMNEGFRMTTLAGSPEHWLVVMTKGTDFGVQESCSAPWTELSEWITDRWDNKGMRITDLSFKDNLWTVVMSEAPSIGDQIYFTVRTTADLKLKVQENWDKGYYITALEYGDGFLFCVMSTNASGKTCREHWTLNPSNISGEISTFWEEDYAISYLGGN